VLVGTEFLKFDLKKANWQPVAYAENFHGGLSFCGIWW